MRHRWLASASLRPSRLSKTILVALVLALVALLAIPTLSAAHAAAHATAHKATVRPLAPAKPHTAATLLNNTWYFAEGYTGPGFIEFLTLENPNATAATATVTYYLESGPPVVKMYPLNASSRTTILVNNEVGAGHSVSMVVTADQPIVAERPIYFTFTGLPGYSISSGTDVIGATSLGTKFNFAYLDKTTGHSTWLTILNPNSSSMFVQVYYYRYSSLGSYPRTYLVLANTRGTIQVNAANIPADAYAAQVTLSAPGLVERPMYLVDGVTGYTGAADVVGETPTLTSNWYFAEGYTSSLFSERYFIFNPNNVPLATPPNTITFYLSDGSQAIATLPTLNPGEPIVFDVNAFLGSGGVPNSASTFSGAPFGGSGSVVERFMSFNYNGTIQGATDSMGTSRAGTEFYFAEGYTGNNFTEFLTLENPNMTPAQVTVTYYLDSGPPIVRVYPVAGFTRVTKVVNIEVGNGQNVSMKVTSDQPIVAERPMYFIFPGSQPQPGGTDVVGFQP